MAVVKLLWSNLLKMTELDFRPDFPASLNISDEVLQVISWLTATTGFDRRLLRCTPQGALLVAQPWSIRNILANYGLLTIQGSTVEQVLVAGTKSVLITTSAEIIKVGFKRVNGGDYEYLYVPPYQYYWFPYACYSVNLAPFPIDTGTGSYIGVNAFN